MPKRCSPPSGVTEATSQTNDEQAAPNPQSEHKPSYRKAVVQDDTPDRKVVVESIHFDGPIQLSENDVAQIIAKANQRILDAGSSGWLEELREIGMRGAWQDRGYFKVMVAAEAHSLGSDSVEERFLVTAHVDEGVQYHLGDLRFVGGTIPEPELQEVFPMHGGELFDVSLVRKGIQALTKLYGSRGYIDFTAVPDTDVDNDLQRISLVMHLDEQKQYRVGNLDILGLAPGLEARLRSIMRPGDVFNPEALHDFYMETPSVDLSDPSSSPLEMHRDVKAGIVNLEFDFRPCT
jgi:outer membrane protein assembly factor BamA